MNKQKIAILVDSCCDMPQKYVDKYGFYVLPLRIIYKNQEFLDGVNITPEDVYGALQKEVPTTSLPDGETLTKMLRQIRKDGYEKVICITISKNLSGTYNQVRLVSQDFEGLEIEIVDTKNISMGSAFSAIQAAKYIEEGFEYEEILKRLNENIFKSKIFFVIDTLEYLQRGGRIGSVTAHLGKVFDLKPIISCNEEGIHYTVQKVRGRKKSLKEIIKLAIERATGSEKIYLAIGHCLAPEEARKMREEILSQLINVEEILEAQVSPAIGVHAGPGTIGIGVYKV